MQKFVTLVLSFIITSCSMQPALAEEVRSAAVIRTFKENNICPSTGKTATKGVKSSYTCKGYVVDHGIPFCAGKYLGVNLDLPHNLFYQKYDKENSLKKDADERSLCRKLKELESKK